eukprot:359882-Chlamydomonas_euryale.AAC.2
MHSWSQESWNVHRQQPSVHERICTMTVQAHTEGMRASRIRSRQSAQSITSVTAATNHPSNTSPHRQVRFRLVVFRPFVGEVLVGQLKSCSREGLRVSLGFFDDILVPDYMLQVG